MMDRNRHSPLDQVISMLGEFLEVAITLLLSVRGVYPAEVYERRRYLNMAVQWARHPGLREYIKSAVTNALPWVQKGIVEYLSVVFIDKNCRPLEKFTFQLRVHQDFTETSCVNDIENALRAFILKLSVSEPLFQPFPPEYTWEIVLFSKQLPGDPKGKGHFWVPAETKLWEQPPVITPVKSMDTGPLNVQLYIEHPSS